MLNGVDISNNNSRVDIASLTDTDFVIVKATQGTWFVDWTCDDYVQQCKANGKLWGFYHFADPGTDPIEEADFFISHTEGYFGEGVPVLDFETDALENGPGWAKRWLDRVFERTGVRPLIYMSASAIHGGFADIAKDYGLWVASYPNVYRPGYDYDPEIGWPIWPWEFAAIHQYASDGCVAGYESNNVDINHFYGDRAAWLAYAGKTSNGEQSGNDTGRGIEIRKITVEFYDGSEQVILP